ncbi:MAG TPA: citramalate synthase [Ignavibacteriales bacterium]|nr:citramalate synthase [Ignavibacteriales bacterium]
MERKTIEIFDTTLRDGTQGEGISVSVQDKLIIAQRLDEFGVDIIEGGWPGSNPRDEEFFRYAKGLNLERAQLSAFGSTARDLKNIRGDANLNALLKAETPVVSIFGKTWRLHAEKGLGLTKSENEELIYNTVRFLKEQGRKVVYDAEHFFDGYKDDAEFALSMLLAAEKAGADVLVLCDTNGGCLPSEIFEIISAIKPGLQTTIGIHAHNDSELAVANSLAAIQAGAMHVQGTINGVGERCGNANLCSIIPNVVLKMKAGTKSRVDLQGLTALSNFVFETMNLAPYSRAAYTGKSAFAHKGGIHVSAVLKDSKMYEHIDPKEVGNKQRVLVSDLAGQSNIRYKARELGVDIEGEPELTKKLIAHIKSMEFEGYQFDGADASFELILHSEMKDFTPYFQVLNSKVNVVSDSGGMNEAEAILKVEVNGELEHTASNGDGPVNALDNALRKALLRFYPEIALIKLVDYKVRVLDEKKGTSAKVRVLIQSSDGSETWSTVGVSSNIFEASLQALNDSINYKLFKLNNRIISQAN